MTSQREMVGLFADREHFQTAVKALVKAGFERSQLSVLSSHQSLDAASGKQTSWRESLIGLVGELKYEGPLVAAGLIALAAGPVGAVIAGSIAAGVGAAAVKELVEDVTSAPDSGEFARALEAGSVILWVAVSDAAKEKLAQEILSAHQASNIHISERT